MAVDQYAEIPDYLYNEIQDDLYTALRKVPDNKCNIIQDDMYNELPESMYNEITGNTLHELLADHCIVFSANEHDVIPDSLHYESIRHNDINTNLIYTQSGFLHETDLNSLRNHVISDQYELENVHFSSATMENLQSPRTMIIDKITKTREICSNGERYIYT